MKADNALIINTKGKCCKRAFLRYILAHKVWQTHEHTCVQGVDML